MREAVGLVVTVRTTDGAAVRGVLESVDAKLNVRVGGTAVRGSRVSFIVLPPMLSVLTPREERRPS